MRTSGLSSAMSDLQIFLRDLRHETECLGDDTGNLTDEEEETNAILDQAEVTLRYIISDLDDFCDTFEAKLEEL